MKKHILITVTLVTALGLTAFRYGIYELIYPNVAIQNADSSLKDNHGKLYAGIPFIYSPFDDFVLEIDSRFDATISREKLLSAASVVDIVPEEANWASYSIKQTKVTVYRDSAETSATGDGALLNDGHVQLLRTVEYASNFSIHASCIEKNEFTGFNKYNELVYYITVTPEKEAEYTMGKDALIQYLRDNSLQDVFNIAHDRLQPGMVSFKVTSAGTISSVKLLATSGHTAIDNKMIELISSIPGLWDSAQNANGEKVDQQLVLFFGAKGC